MREPSTATTWAAQSTGLSGLFVVSTPGSRNVNAGTLLANNADGSATGASTMGVNVASGAGLGGDGAIAGNISFSAGAKFAFVAGSTLDFSGSVSFGGFGVSDILGLDAATTEGVHVLLNSVGGSISQANVSNIGFGNALAIEGSGKLAYFDFDGGDLALVVTAIPEPGSFALVGGFAAVGFAGLRRRRRSA